MKFSVVKKDTKALIMEYFAEKGGLGSGNFGHAGRPGKVGGSAESKPSGSAFVSHADEYPHYTPPPSDKISDSVRKNFVGLTLGKNGTLLEEELPDSDLAAYQGYVDDVSKLTGIDAGQFKTLICKNKSSFSARAIEMERREHLKKHGEPLSKDDEDYLLQVIIANALGLQDQGNQEIIINRVPKKINKYDIWLHELGHAILIRGDTGDTKSKYRVQYETLYYRNPYFDRHTQYALSRATESFAESFSAYVRAGAKFSVGNSTFDAVKNVIEGAKKVNVSTKGGPGSGYFGHAGRPGERGGSAAGNTSFGGVGKPYQLGKTVPHLLSDVPLQTIKKINITDTIRENFLAGSHIPALSDGVLSMYDFGAFGLNHEALMRDLAFTEKGNELFGKELVKIFRADIRKAKKTEDPVMDIHETTCRYMPEFLSAAQAIDLRLEGKGLVFTVPDISGKFLRKCQSLVDNMDYAKDTEVYIQTYGELYEQDPHTSNAIPVGEFLGLKHVFVKDDGTVSAKESSEKGGPGSGYFNHAGRPGKRGGSAPASASSGDSGNPKLFENFDQLFKEAGDRTIVRYFILPDGNLLLCDRDREHAESMRNYLLENDIDGISEKSKQEFINNYRVHSPENGLLTISLFPPEMREKLTRVAVYKRGPKDTFIDITTDRIDRKSLRDIQSFFDNSKLPYNLDAFIEWTAYGAWNDTMPYHGQRAITARNITAKDILESKGVTNTGFNKFENADVFTLKEFSEKGGPGSGFFGHAGRPGKIGGSSQNKQGGGVTNYRYEYGEGKSDVVEVSKVRSNTASEVESQGVLFHGTTRDVVKKIVASNNELTPTIGDLTSTFYGEYRTDENRLSNHGDGEEYLLEPFVYLNGPKVGEEDDAPIKRALHYAELAVARKLNKTDVTDEELGKYGAIVAVSKADSYYVKGMYKKTDDDRVIEVEPRFDENDNFLGFADAFVHYDWPHIGQESGDYFTEEPVGVSFYLYGKELVKLKKAHDKGMSVVEYERYDDSLFPLSEYTAEKGGPGSGYFNHAGRPGKRGGSAPQDASGSSMTQVYQGVVSREINENGSFSMKYEDKITGTPEYIMAFDNYDTMAETVPHFGGGQWGYFYLPNTGMFVISTDQRETSHTQLLYYIAENAPEILRENGISDEDILSIYHMDIDNYSDKPSLIPESVRGDVVRIREIGKGDAKQYSVTTNKINSRTMSKLQSMISDGMLDDPSRKGFYGRVITWNCYDYYDIGKNLGKSVVNSVSMTIMDLMSHSGISIFDDGSGYSLKNKREPDSVENMFTAGKQKNKDSREEIARGIIRSYVREFKGGKGSGYFNHAGRPGKRGGSAPATRSGSAGGQEILDLLEESESGIAPRLARVGMSDEELVKEYGYKKKRSYTNSDYESGREKYQTRGCAILLDNKILLSEAKAHGYHTQIAACYFLETEPRGSTKRNKSRHVLVEDEWENVEIEKYIEGIEGVRLDFGPTAGKRSMGVNISHHSSSVNTANRVLQTVQRALKRGIIDIPNLDVFIFDFGKSPITIEGGKIDDVYFRDLGGEAMIVSEKGGPGSGFFGHAGRPGKIGGSSQNKHTERARAMSAMLGSSAPLSIRNGVNLEKLVKAEEGGKGMHKYALYVIDRPLSSKSANRIPTEDTYVASAMLGDILRRAGLDKGILPEFAGSGNYPEDLIQLSSFTMTKTNKEYNDEIGDDSLAQVYDTEQLSIRPIDKDGYIHDDGRKIDAYTVLAHEVAHLISNARWNKVRNTYTEKYENDPTYGRFTEYSQYSAEESFAESFVMYLGANEKTRQRIPELKDIHEILEFITTSQYKEATSEKGGPGSGYFGHAGRPGKRGGSAPLNSSGVPQGKPLLSHFDDLPHFVPEKADYYSEGTKRNTTIARPGNKYDMISEPMRDEETLKEIQGWVDEVKLCTGIDVTPVNKLCLYDSVDNFGYGIMSFLIESRRATSARELTPFEVYDLKVRLENSSFGVYNRLTGEINVSPLTDLYGAKHMKYETWLHELGHAIFLYGKRDARAEKLPSFSKSYDDSFTKDISFDRKTEYAETNVRESFSETFCAYVRTRSHVIRTGKESANVGMEREFREIEKVIAGFKKAVERRSKKTTKEQEWQNKFEELLQYSVKGGPGSGYFNHAGRPGKEERIIGDDVVDDIIERNRKIGIDEWMEKYYPSWRNATEIVETRATKEADKRHINKIL